jgi:hypothetical protein
MGIIIPPPKSVPEGVSLPREPTREQLRELLANRLVMPGGLIVGVSFGEPPKPAPLRSAEMALRAYSTLSEIAGEGSSPELVAQMATRWAWAPTVLKLSVLAALVAEHGPEGAITRALTVEPLRSHAVVANDFDARVSDYARAHGDKMVVAHGDILYFLQSLAILYGAEDGPVPSDRELAYWMLMAGDHLPGWKMESAPAVTPLESGVALMARASLFTSKEDVALSLARAKLLFGRPPRRGRFTSAAKWEELQHEAFGCSFAEYLDQFVTPLTTSAVMWGKRNANGGLVPPLIHPSTWLRQTKLDNSRPLAELDKLVISREDAREKLRRHLTPAGLPRSPAFFYRQPFIRVGADSVVGLSPMAVYGHLRGGIWAKFLAATKHRTGAAEPWQEAFGYLTEQYCRELAKDVARSEQSPDRVVEWPREEIEDLVLANGNAVALISVKSRLMDERYLRQASSPRDVIGWFNEVLFRQKSSRTDRHRSGALRQLDAAVARIRAGRYEPLVARDVEVFPVLVMFEEVFDTYYLQQWVGETCSRIGLFAGERVRPVVLASLTNLELMLGLLARGISVVDVLRAKASPEWRQRPLQHVIAHESRGHQRTRPPAVERAYRDVLNSSTMKMFGRPLPDDGDDVS